MKIIRFIRYSSPYNPGDVASFEDAVADAYIQAGAAVEEQKPQKQKPEQEKRK